MKIKSTKLYKGNANCWFPLGFFYYLGGHFGLFVIAPSRKAVFRNTVAVASVGRSVTATTHRLSRAGAATAIPAASRRADEVDKLCSE